MKRNKGQPRLCFAAANSGGGKTMAVCSFLQALKNRGYHPIAFKSGPDYIDPMFHKAVLGYEGYNLDLFLNGRQTVKSLFASHEAEGDISVIEGAMGYYDGVSGGEEASAYQVAAATKTPVILIVNPKGASLSLAALVNGFSSFRSDSNIKGLLLNPCSAMLYKSLKPMLEQQTGIPVMGYLPKLSAAAVKSRHLGLAIEEAEKLQESIEEMGKAAECCFDMEGLLAIAEAAPTLDEPPIFIGQITEKPPIIAVAMDEAFCFYYADNLQLLQKLGAILSFFSPLHDDCLPKGISGIYLGGGYPELHCQALSENYTMLESIRSAIKAGLPTVAECGGYLYLLDALENQEGISFPMVGVISGKGYQTKTLTQFGYITLTAQHDCMLCRKGERIPAHEFHYWRSTADERGFTAEKPNKKKDWSSMYTEKNIAAGFPHLHFYGNLQFAERFIKAAEEANYEGFSFKGIL